MHYYSSSGEPRHFEGKGGKPTTLREFRKNPDWRPGVTTIQKVWAKPGLVQWQIQQAILSSLTLPRIDGENDTDFAKRVAKDATDESKKAMDKGTQIHDAIERGEGPWYLGLSHELSERGLTIVSQEKVVVSKYYAGKYDMIVCNAMGDECVVDIKGQSYGEKGPNIYPEWVEQLAAYKHACDPAPLGCMSVVFHREDPQQWVFHE